jgi:hypothetical protein
MLEILTPLAKCIRVSRPMDPATFLAKPGIWAEVAADGSLLNVSGAPVLVNKMVISSASDNEYESHDVEVGRITTLEGPYGTRFKVDSEGKTGTITQGDMLVVSNQTGEEGKLRRSAGLPAGTYEIVARAEQVDTIAGFMIAELLSPTTVTIAST